QKDFSIDLAEPLKSYQRLIELFVQDSEVVDDEVTKANFESAAKSARKAIWELLLQEPPTPEKLQKAKDLLGEYRGDACFYDPWTYNSWIVELRDEILKQEALLPFWRNTIVQEQLGPCWARDCDLFDAEDKPPLEFYAHAGCTAPFAASLKVRAALEQAEGPAEPTTPGEMTADETAALSGNFEAVLTKENPLEDYRTLMKRFILVKIIVPDDVQKVNVEKVQKAARDMIWKLLFDESPASPEDQNKAGELLLEYRQDAGFYSPWLFNDWIVELRDEVLERQLLDFWREKMVKLELGPCSHRDSDYFDRDDPLPLEFYQKEGCQAPFKEESD
ncbi:hypothetical protein KR018_008846, partial [Drosophila ironensis]